MYQEIDQGPDGQAIKTSPEVDILHVHPYCLYKYCVHSYGPADRDVTEIAKSNTNTVGIRSGGVEVVRWLLPASFKKSRTLFAETKL